jgi:LysR family glycine cleavage system transcriptional activator
MQALQAVEAAARTGSMTRAAAELCVTHGAVSRHVRELEAQLGFELFHRDGRQLSVTPRGRRLAEDLQQALRAVGRALDEAAAERQPTRPQLRLNVDPELASLWLVPRLGRLRAAHPDVDLVIETSTEHPDFTRAELDISLRYAFAPFAGCENVRLLNDEVILVCSPEFASAHAPMHIDRLAKLPRLRYTRFPWSQWGEAAGVSVDDPDDGPVFDSRALMIEAAAGGMGLGLTRSLLALDYLASGRLVRPFSASFPASLHCYVVWRANNPQAALIRRLCEQFVHMAAESRTVNAASEARAPALEAG